MNIKTDKKVKKNFKQHYFSLPEKERFEVRDKFLAESMIPYPTWYSKIYRGKFSRLELNTLENICGVQFES